MFVLPRVVVNALALASVFGEELVEISLVVAALNSGICRRGRQRDGLAVSEVFANLPDAPKCVAAALDGPLVRKHHAPAIRALDLQADATSLLNDLPISATGLSNLLPKRLHPAFCLRDGGHCPKSMRYRKCDLGVT